MAVILIFFSQSGGNRKTVPRPQPTKPLSLTFVGQWEILLLRVRKKRFPNGPRRIPRPFLSGRVITSVVSLPRFNRRRTSKRRRWRLPFFVLPREFLVGEPSPDDLPDHLQDHKIFIVIAESKWPKFGHSPVWRWGKTGPVQLPPLRLFPALSIVNGSG